MDFGSMLDESFAYAKEGVWGRWSRWLLLIISIIIFPLIMGYMVRIYRGDKPAPELRDWAPLFIDGLKLLAIHIIYFLPVILLLILAFVPLVSTLVTSGALAEDFGTMTESQTERWLDSHPDLLASAGFMVLVLLAAVLLAIIISFFSFLGVIRFARTNAISEAFNFTAIIAFIRRIGWINYIVALFILFIIGIIFSAVLDIFSFVPFIGDFLEPVIMMILYVPYILFTARYSSLVYDAGTINGSQ